MRQAGERGQVVILVLIALSLFLIGAIGLAIDASHMYAQRQMAQAAADAAVQAAAMSMLGKTNTTGYNASSTPACAACAFGASDFTCTNGTDGRTPCVYARLSGFGQAASSDVVDVSFPATSTAPGVRLSPDFAPNLVSVTIRRTVDSTLMRFLGPSTANVRVSATAACVQDDNPVPILVLHPTLCSALQRIGKASITICGGPTQSIQVNSNCNPAEDDNGGGVIDLSKAGPNDSGLCDTGTGGIFGSFGGPDNYPNPANLLLGTDGEYQRRAPITDPYEDVFPSGPPIPPDAPLPPLARAPNVDGCPAAPAQPCMLYSPGRYGPRPGVPNGGLEVKNETALFKPGYYYMDGPGGFKNASLGIMMMAGGAAGAPDTTSVAPTGAGMVVYNTGPLVGAAPQQADAGEFDVGSNSNATLVGSDGGSVWKGILFFQDRNSVSHTGVCCSHKLGGGGIISLKGSIYLTNAGATTATRYQQFTLRGNPGSTTEIIGNIVVDAMNTAGTPAVRMQLDPLALKVITKVALIQ